MIKKSQSKWESTPKSIRNVVGVLTVLLLISLIVLSWNLLYSSKNSIAGHASESGGSDIDKDGILDKNDEDIDADGTDNERDGDVDGDGITNYNDKQPYGPDSECIHGFPSSCGFFDDSK